MDIQNSVDQFIEGFDGTILIHVFSKKKKKINHWNYYGDLNWSADLSTKDELRKIFCIYRRLQSHDFLKIMNTFIFFNLQTNYPHAKSPD